MVIDFWRLRLRAVPPFRNSVDQAKMKGHPDVDHYMGFGDGEMGGGPLSLRLRAVAVESGTLSYGEKLRVRLFPLRGKVICGGSSMFLYTPSVKRPLAAFFARVVRYGL